jgi:hypothetical protein
LKAGLWRTTSTILEEKVINYSGVGASSVLLLQLRRIYCWRRAPIYTVRFWVRGKAERAGVAKAEMRSHAVGGLQRTVAAKVMLQIRALDKGWV